MYHRHLNLFSNETIKYGCFFLQFRQSSILTSFFTSQNLYAGFFSAYAKYKAFRPIVTKFLSITFQCKKFIKRKNSTGENIAVQIFSKI